MSSMSMNRYIDHVDAGADEGLIDEGYVDEDFDDAAVDNADWQDAAPLGEGVMV